MEVNHVVITIVLSFCLVSTLKMFHMIDEDERFVPHTKEGYPFHVAVGLFTICAIIPYIIAHFFFDAVSGDFFPLTVIFGTLIATIVSFIGLRNDYKYRNLQPKPPEPPAPPPPPPPLPSLADGIADTMERVGHLTLDPTGIALKYYAGPYQIDTKYEPITDQILETKVRRVLPYSLRTEHMQVLASSGHGKTSLFQSLIIDDLEEDAAIIVIDSQNQMIDKLAEYVPADRLILVDPEHCPPALNMFDIGAADEKGIANAMELYEYIFAALDAEMTSKQKLVYRYLSRLCIAVPGASLVTMRDMLEDNGLAPYVQYLPQLGDNAAAFFREFMTPRNQYTETRQEVRRRLLTVLESATFNKMLSAPTNKLDIAGAIQAGKVVLVSTNKALLKGNAALLGRIILAQVLQAVTARQGGKRVYLYIDEFRDYADDSDILIDMITQSRKYNLGMIFAHQSLGQLPPKLAAEISASTSIKFAGSISYEDSVVMAKRMAVDPSSFERLPKGSFMAWFRGHRAMPWYVQLGRLESLPKRNNIDQVRAAMRARFGNGPPPAPQSTLQVAPPPPPSPPSPPQVQRAPSRAPYVMKPPKDGW